MDETCRIVHVDGDAIRVRCDREMDAEDLVAFSAIVRAAKVKLAEMPPNPRLTHDPCCSSHGIAMTCARYRRSHFVEVRPCCDADAVALGMRDPESVDSSSKPNGMVPQTSD